ncbi:MAG: cupin domain-containing protein [Marinobacterium sp.]|nr:cupin domain-containing protein [Marinobacterium sp.]
MSDLINLLQSLPCELAEEQFLDLLKTDSLRIERILSNGQSSPKTGWYDQSEHEWVLVLQGAGTLEFEQGESVTLCAGDSLNIPAHCRHRVSWTDPKQITVWLAVFYG